MSPIGLGEDGTAVGYFESREDGMRIDHPSALIGTELLVVSLDRTAKDDVHAMYSRLVAVNKKGIAVGCAPHGQALNVPIRIDLKRRHVEFLADEKDDADDHAIGVDDKVVLASFPGRWRGRVAVYDKVLKPMSLPDASSEAVKITGAGVVIAKDSHSAWYEEAVWHPLITEQTEFLTVQCRSFAQCRRTSRNS